MNEKIKILIVEDDLIIAENIKYELTDMDFDVPTPCNSLDKAIEKLESENFDLALLDINLNGKEEGIELGSIITSKYKIPVIFLTAYSDKATIEAASKCRPGAYLVKPVSAVMLFAAIQTAIYNFQNNKTAVQPEVEEQTQQDVFFVKVGKKLSRISWNEVVSLSSGRNYISAQINKKGIPEIPIRCTLNHALNSLMPAKTKNKFVQISRFHCINVDYIIHIKENNIITDFGDFEISAKYKPDLLNKLNIINNRI